MDEIISLDALYADEDIANELYELVQNGLSVQLNVRLAEISNRLEHLTALTWHDEEKLSLLMVAALNGHDEIIRVLFAHCDSKYQVELKGKIAISDDEYLDGTTALYCACYRKHFTVAQTLIQLGHADVNQDTVDNPKYPLLIQASMMDRLDIVRFLVENGYSDVNDTKSDDGDKCNALIWAAFRAHSRIVSYLIENNADVNYTCTGEDLIATTPIACATLRGCPVSVKLLVCAGADTSVRNRQDDTLLQLAIDKKYFSVINLFLELSVITVDDVELAACSCITMDSSIRKMEDALEILHLALEYRATRNSPKFVLPPMFAYDYAQECQTTDELDSIKSDAGRMLVEIQLVRERILLSRNDQNLMRSLLDYGDMLVARDEFEKCLDLWIHAFYLYQNMGIGTILHRFVWLFCKMIEANRTISIKLFLKVCSLTFEPSQKEFSELNIDNALLLIVLASKVLDQPEVTRDDKVTIYRWIHDFCRKEQTAPNGATLLHRCVDEATNDRINWRETDINHLIRFPNEHGLSLLLTAGIHWLNLDAIEPSQGETPLHIICRGSENEKIVELLVNAGAHIDCVNRYGELPVDCTYNAKIRAFLTSKQPMLNLKCLCARIIANQRLNPNSFGQLVPALNRFVLLHGGHK